MSDLLLVGLGTVGLRAGRQLVDTPAVGRLLLADRDLHRAEKVAGMLGPKAEALRWSPGEPLPGGLAAVACALPDGADRQIVEHALVVGSPTASVADDHTSIERLRELHDAAVEAGVTVAAGCGMAPGLTCVLARHAADGFDAVDEIRVARTGWAGPASVNAVRYERRSTPVEWRDGAWRDDRRSGDALVWFPDPIGARDCQPVTAGVSLLVDAFPDVDRISVCLGEPRSRMRWWRRLQDEGEWGAARVEVWGRRGRARDLVVYGVVERTAVAAGAVLAVTALHLGGIGVERSELPGVHGLAGLLPPVPVLTELSQRGVRAAVFEGVPVA